MYPNWVSSRDVLDVWVFVDFQLSSAFAEEELYRTEVLFAHGEVLPELAPGELDKVVAGFLWIYH
jgi:hypothetical protein